MIVSQNFESIVSFNSWRISSFSHSSYSQISVWKTRQICFQEEICFVIRDKCFRHNSSARKLSNNFIATELKNGPKYFHPEAWGWFSSCFWNRWNSLFMLRVEASFRGVLVGWDVCLEKLTFSTFISFPKQWVICSLHVPRGGTACSLFSKVPLKLRAM